ncbi:hypothetical protein E4T42_07093 [Aureobasidium subglaciale]|uniref:F-box domain-containing protein n=1 Tax=Aureobasidium subglaciale (strain EXF-2481) TaxID=1043005 RepID=A0A074ZGL1_AURSE|nr:uncharacterized protein AUEXF2481DRAFT_2628 [Aureobasidium subglaciale EXF-2481]KAI5196051.1 hypothetical protein E4T38_08745 [Aureobasidium subglaciale]KAI5215424.1 hypothetical protein E4T40_08410 [Aureobasidium subglaciale]KAI5217975.1 hypothetical protein E4T41_08611 [Aureobasidium subglaciale]KAI5244576.1 hypothetical protein E4T42_07093 [Aureobasidium subglaciale]KAI5255649.1 hypothetical protein E4T46_08646 [Aureobasidium subglaciale]
MPLVDLPPELLLRISAYLTTIELGNFRLISKHVENTIFDSFAREFFTKKQFMLEQVSLQALVDISNHPTLAPRLAEVVISTHVFPSDHELATPCGKAMYEAGYASHDVLLATGQALNMLSDAFSKLPNLRTIGLRDYNGRGRFRDGDLATWKSWAWSFGWEDMSAYSPAGQFLRPLVLISPEAILPLVFYALGQAKVSPESVHIFLRKHARLTPRSFDILNGYLGEKVRPVLGEIKELMLAIGPDTPQSYFRSDPSNGHGPATDAPLTRLLERTPKLETLRLNFDPRQSFAARFLDWLGDPVSGQAHPSTSLVTQPVLLPRLSALELGMLSISADVLLKVLTKFDLQSFSLWKVTLDDVSESGEEDHWQPLLYDLAAALPQSTRLKSVLIGFPSHTCRGVVPFRSGPRLEDPVFFKPIGAGAEGTYNTSDLAQEVKHHAGPGTSMKVWLEELSTRTIVKRQEDISDVSDSDEEAIHDDIEDDEDDEDDENDEDDDEDE